MKKSLPFGAIVMLLILALATVGVGYGLWAKTVTIRGTVNTGELNVALSVEEIDESRDFDAWYCPNGGGYSIGKDCDADGNLDDDLEYEDKDWVASCDAVPVDNGEYPDLENEGPQGMLVTIENAYPSFNCFIQWNVENTGTIPVKVKHPRVYAWTGTEWEELGPGFLLGGNYGWDGEEYIYHLNSWPPTIGDETCYLNGTQLERGEIALCNLHFHLGQLAEMDETYYFKVEAFVHQWNEAVP
jgi:hypothetical protein